MAITLLVIVALAAVVAWGFGMIGEWLVEMLPPQRVRLDAPVDR